LGTGNSVGAIPSIINGGLSALIPLIGYGSDQIVSAKLITATGEHITISENENSDLLYALKGAGQYFGVVTSLTLKIHPLSILGTPDNTIWAGTMGFVPTRAKEVFDAIVPLMKSVTGGGSALTHKTAGLIIFTSPPPVFQPFILVAAFYLGTDEAAQAFYKPVLDLKPDMLDLKVVPFDAMNDFTEPFCVKGDFKQWGGTGLHGVTADDLHFLLEKYLGLIEEAPGAAATGYAVEWTTEGPFNDKAVEGNTAFSHRDIKNWV
jgi:hypothetical protein